jgi:thioredoxin-related protein
VGEEIMRKWTSATSAYEMAKGKYLGPVEFKDRHGEWHVFDIVATPHRIVFGGVTNTGFMESGYMPRDNHFSLDVLLQEMLKDLKVYYDFGKHYVSNIVTSARM